MTKEGYVKLKFVGQHTLTFINIARFEPDEIKEIPAADAARLLKDFPRWFKRVEDVLAAPEDKPKPKPKKDEDKKAA